MHSFSNRKTILLYGETGNGKSSFGNIILGSNLFPISDYEDSFTTKTSKKSSLIFPTIDVIDTPGFSDSDGRDDSLFNDLKGSLKNERIDFVLLILNFQTPKFDRETQLLVKILCNVFPRNLIQHLGIVFTFYNQKDELRKIGGRGDPKDSKYKYYVPKVRDFICRETNEVFEGSIPTFFVESNNEYDTNTKEEIKRLITLVRTIYPIEEINDRVNLKYKYKREIFIHEPPQEEMEGNRKVIVRRTYVQTEFTDHFGNKTYGEKKLFRTDIQDKEKDLKELPIDNNKNSNVKLADTINIHFQSMKFANYMNSESKKPLNMLQKMGYYVKSAALLSLGNQSNK